jgi:hypothetical protein
MRRVFTQMEAEKRKHMTIKLRRSLEGLMKHNNARIARSTRTSGTTRAPSRPIAWRSTTRYFDAHLVFRLVRCILVAGISACVRWLIGWVWVC